jgi:outer membrane protein assembly factor BamA
MLISVEEERMSSFAGILGYVNSESSNDRLSGFIDLAFNNLFGSDRNLVLHWNRTSADRSKIEINYHEAGPISIPVSGDFRLSREEVDSTYVSNNLESDIYYFENENRYGLFFGLDQIFPGSRRPKTVEKTNFIKAGVFWKYSSLDNDLNPTSGKALQIRFYNIFHEEKGDSKSKNAVETMWKYYFKTGRSTVLTSGINAKVIENRNLTEFDFFNLGGLRSLRGFLENEFYGFRTGWINNEFRYLLSRNSRIYTFLDYGYVENASYTFGKLFSVGFGLRIATRLGIFEVDYGLGYSDGKFKDPLQGLIHFGLEANL